MTDALPHAWLKAPEPTISCPRCRQLDRQREMARRQGDRSAESDCNVLMRQHLKEAHG